MKAVLNTAPGVLSTGDVVLRDLLPDEAHVQIHAAALCITDTFVVDGIAPTPFPNIPGHSAVGTVLATGSNCSRVRVGDRVAVVGSSQCGRCHSCLTGSPSACVDNGNGFERTIGTDAEGTAVYTGVGIGALAEEMLYRESNLVPIEASAPTPYLALLGCGISSGVGAVLEVGKIRPGNSVAILGCGHLGLWMVQGAALAGASRIVVIDPDENRCRLAAQLGATDIIVGSGAEAVRQVIELTGGLGVDVAFEAAGQVSAVSDAFGMARGGGTVVATGMESPTSAVAIDNFSLIIGAKTIVGSQTGGGDIVSTVPRYARLLAQGTLDAEPIVTAIYSLDDAAIGIDAMRHGGALTGVVITSTSGQLPSTLATESNAMP